MKKFLRAWKTFESPGSAAGAKIRFVRSITCPWTHPIDAFLSRAKSAFPHLRIITYDLMWRHLFSRPTRKGVLMRLGRVSAYGLLALMTIADHDEQAGCATARDIADQSGVPVEYLRKVLQRLANARLIRSERGRAGGFRLRRPFQTITLLQVVEAVEGPIDDVAILEDGLLESTPHRASQRLRRWRHDAAARLRHLLRETSLHDIFNGVAARVR